MNLLMIFIEKCGCGKVARANYRVAKQHIIGFGGEYWDKGIFLLRCEDTDKMLDLLSEAIGDKLVSVHYVHCEHSPIPLSDYK